jgi:hypothetical protein
MSDCSNIIFLGACEKASYVNYRETNLGVSLGKWNVLGLKPIVLVYIFPLSLKGLMFGFAVNLKKVDDSFTVTFISRKGKEVGYLNIETRVDSKFVNEYDNSTNSILIPSEGWSPYFFRIKDENLLITEPGDYFLTIKSKKGVQIIGQVGFYAVTPAPLTADRISAIRSDPTSAKTVQITLGCKKCLDSYKVYSSIDGSKSKIDKKSVLYSTVPDEYICKCKETVINLKYIRNNLHGLLGQRMSDRLDMAFLPMYEKSSLEKVKRKFIKLIESDEHEEVVQIFIQENLILLHQFPSEKILFKPPILNKLKADFGIVCSNKILILIEIEKTYTKLLKKNGEAHSELNHAFNQVRDWLHECNEHRLAVLDSMKIDREKVSKVTGIVIAGRDSGCDAKHLRKLKGSNFGDISFFTYDDLLFSLDTLIDKIDNL